MIKKWIRRFSKCSCCSNYYFYAVVLLWFSRVIVIIVIIIIVIFVLIFKFIINFAEKAFINMISRINWCFRYMLWIASTWWCCCRCDYTKQSTNYALYETRWIRTKTWFLIDLWWFWVKLKKWVWKMRIMYNKMCKKLLCSSHHYFLHQDLV